MGRLEAAKVPCSASPHVHRPVIIAAGKDGTRMLALNMDEHGLDKDMTYCRPIGMRSPVSCRFDFTGIPFDDDQISGGAYDYVGEPDFISVAARFAAVQLGGADAVIRATVLHLKKMQSTGAPAQIARSGRSALIRETGNGPYSQTVHERRDPYRSDVREKVPEARDR